MKPKLLYKSMPANLKSNSGNVEWKIGEWQKCEGKLELCKNGFHASKRIIDAMGFVNMEILAQVEVRGKSKKEKDKEVWSEMRIIKAWEWTKKDSVSLAIFAAELCLKNFEKIYPNDDRPRKAIEAAKKVLENDTAENRSAAQSAAQSATWFAAWSAQSAAWSAAWSAQAAAWFAAWSAQSAAWSAAWSAQSAAWSAARSAQSAAQSAAWSAARSAQSAEKILNKCEEFILDRIKDLKEIKWKLFLKYFVEI